MKLLIIGAGYVGRALLHQLQSTHHEIYVTTTDALKLSELKPLAKEVILLEDSRNFKELLDSVDGAIIMVAPKNHATYRETYFDTALKFSSALRGRTRPFYFIYTSSTGVYEGTAKDWVTEDDILDPQSENGKTLLESENVYLEASEGAVLRLGGIYGPGREIEKRAHYFCGKEQLSDGNEPTNSICLDDIVAALLFCLEHRLSGIYNLVEDHHPTRRELYDKLCSSLSLEAPRWNEKTIGKRYKVSNKKILNQGFVFIKDDAKELSKKV